MAPNEANLRLRALVILYGATLVAAVIGSFGSMSSTEFYQQLMLPGFAPPSSVFGPVWSLLYFLMATAAFLVWRSDFESRTRPVLTLYLIHLVINALWSWLFFAWQTGLGATVGVLVLLGMVVWLTLRFRYYSKAAMLLMVPYVLWVGYATLLTISIWQLNPQLL